VGKRKSTTPPETPLALVPPVASGTPAPDRPLSPDGDDVFDARELAYIQARSEGKTIKDAAKAARPPFPYSSARRLDDRADIRQALRRAAREAVDCGVRTLAQAATAAADALKDVAERGGTGDGPRVSAARACLELSIQSLKIDDVLQRVEALESRQEQRPGKPGQFGRN
jgi:hypothetical protein